MGYGSTRAAISSCAQVCPSLPNPGLVATAWKTAEAGFSPRTLGVNTVQLNKDLVREILLAIEADQGDPREPKRLDLPGYTGQEVSYHVRLLAEASFLEAVDFSSFDGYEWQPQRLTYAGHEFLDTIRDPEIWQNAKEGARKVGAASVQLIWQIATAYAKAKAKHLGIDV